MYFVILLCFGVSIISYGLTFFVVANNMANDDKFKAYKKSKALYLAKVTLSKDDQSRSAHLPKNGNKLIGVMSSIGLVAKYARAFMRVIITLK